MAYYNGDFDQFLQDRLKRCKAARFSIADKRAHPKMGKNRSSKYNRKLVWLAVSYLVVIALLFGSFGTAYAAKDSLPNEPLYVVKLAGEDLQLLLTHDINARISLLTTFADRRVDETNILASQGQPVPEQISVLIDEYQEDIATLTASQDDESLVQDPASDEPASDGVYNYQRPRDQDHEDDQAGNTHRNSQPDSPEDQTTTTVDLMIVDQTNTKTGTNENSDKMNTTQTGSGPNNSSGQGYRQENSSGPEYEYSPTEFVPSPNYGSGPNYGTGNTSVVLQQPPTTNPLMGDGNPNQSTGNKGNKP